MRSFFSRSFPNLAAFALILFSVAAPLSAQSVSDAYVFVGPAVGGNLEGAGRFGFGVDFGIAPHIDFGAEIGTIHKHDVGVLASGDVNFHVASRARHREAWDPFLVLGVSAARISGTSGFYLNLGGGVNYWISPRWALRGEFKGYPGGQDLGGFAEFRFGVTFRP